MGERQASYGGLSMANNENRRMTKEDLVSLDNYGHKCLKDFTEMQLNEYATLLQMRRSDVLDRISELRKGDQK